jgi:hypothetical protein
MGTEQSEVFVSYSHRDAQWLERLRVHLAPLVRDLGFNVWDDTRIDPGMRWREEISQAVSSAKVAVLLISADFVASDFITKNELPPLLRAADERGAKILPIILSPSRFQRSELSQFQAVNDPERPLTTLQMPEQEAIFDEVAEIIESFLTNQEPIKPSAQDDLLALLMLFLRQWERYYFNATRIHNWGSKQAGFERLRDYSTSEIRSGLEQLAADDKVRTKEGGKGSTVYIVR